MHGASLQGAIIQTSEQLFEWASRNSNLKVGFVSEQECIAEKLSLEPRFKTSIKMPGIRSIHAALPSDEKLLMKVVSTCSNGTTYNTIKNTKAQKRKIC